VEDFHNSMVVKILSQIYRKFQLGGKFMKDIKLDDIDQKILNLLSKNSRMSYVAIGKEVNLSRVAVKQRIESLEEQGIIEQYSIIINPQKIGRTVSAFFDIEVEPEKFYEVATKLAGKDPVTDIYQMTGSSNLHMHAVMKLNEDLEKFLRDELYVIKGIKKINCRLILSRIKVRETMRI